MKSDFSMKVIRTIQKIPKGKVATYKQIAELSGSPGAVRAVVYILHSCSEAYGLPWQRVINAKGEIAFRKGSRNYHTQRRMLMREGVELINRDQVSLARFQWRKKARITKNTRGAPAMFS